MKLVTPLALLCALCCAVFAADAPEYPQQGPDIYDTKADGFAQIAAALKQAKAGNKNVLLDFGANWCPWCHRLHTLFTTNQDVAATLERNYVVVMIDSNWRHGEKRNFDVNLKYGYPLHEGLPVLLVLDPEGNRLVTQETGALENGKDGHDPAKVLAFLNKWAPKR